MNFKEFLIIIQKLKFLNFIIILMGIDCSPCSCNDQKQEDELSALYLDKKGDKLNEKEKEKIFIIISQKIKSINNFEL